MCSTGDEFGEPIIPERKIRTGALFRSERDDNDDDNQIDDARTYAKQIVAVARSTRSYG